MQTQAISTDPASLLRLLQAQAEVHAATLKILQAAIEALSPNRPEPLLIGLKQASIKINKSDRWLKGKLELGELTGWKTGPKGRWQIDPSILLDEIKALHQVSKQDPQPKKRRKRMLT